MVLTVLPTNYLLLHNCDGGWSKMDAGVPQEQYFGFVTLGLMDNPIKKYCLREVALDFRLEEVPLCRR